MARTSLTMWTLLSIALLPACSDDAPSPGDGPPSVQALPDEFHGEWLPTGTSGGLDGKGVPDTGGPALRLVVTRENTLERRRPDGTVAGVQHFAVRKGRTIFSEEKRFVIVLEGGMELVPTIRPDGSLVMSENVYDGYSTTYRRVETPPR